MHTSKEYVLDGKPLQCSQVILDGKHRRASILVVSDGEEMLFIFKMLTQTAWYALTL